MGIIKEIFNRRNLIQELVLRDLKIRYSRPALGFFWAFLSPLLTVVIFYVVFSLILRVNIKEAPFILYLMSGIFSWRFFQDSLLGSVTSLVDNKNLIKESRFPHYLIPFAIVLANGINFFPGLAILIISSFVILKAIPPFIVLLPAVLAIQLSLTLGVSLISCVLYVKWRDLKYALETFIMVLFYLTPAFYSLSLVKDSFSPLMFRLYINNPLVCILSLYRITMLKGFYPAIKEHMGLSGLFAISALSAVVFLALGFYIYRKSEKHINDYLFY